MTRTQLLYEIVSLMGKIMFIGFTLDILIFIFVMI